MDAEQTAEEEAAWPRDVGAASPSAGDPGPGSDPSSGNPRNKRSLSESPSLDAAGVEDGDRDGHASKRLKLAESEPPDPQEQTPPASQSVAAEVGVPAGDPVLGPFQNGRTPGALPAPVSTVDAVSPKTDPERASLQELLSLGRGGDPPAPLAEVVGSCPPGDVEAGARCSPCGPQPSPASDLELHTAPQTLPSRELAGGRLDHRAENGVALAPKAFSCALCGFQCPEESLLTAHCLGKTHLRRQKLADRGGLVEILTKQPLLKKPCATGTKGMCPKPRASPPLSPAGSGHGKGPRLEGAGGGSELLEHVRPSGAPPGCREQTDGPVTACGVGGSPQGQAADPGPLGVSQGASGNVDATNAPLQTAQVGCATPRPRFEHSVHVLGSGLRRRGGAFALKGQVKKRLSLLGISKRGAVDSPRTCTKLPRTPAKGSGTQQAPRHPAVSGSDQAPCTTSSDTQLPAQGRAISPDPEPVRPTAHPQVPGAHTVGARVAAEGPEPQLHLDSGRLQATPFSQQTSSRDPEHRPRRTQLPPAGSILGGHGCPFVAPGERDPWDCMKEQQHSVGFLCTPCNLFFFSAGDVELHQRTESHAQASAQPRAPQLPGGDSTSATSPPCLLEAGDPKASVSEPGPATQEELPAPGASQGGEGRHCSRPQFQCKKCFYKTRSSTVLSRHIRLRHGQGHHFLCKACDLYSLSKEAMEKHIKRSRHLENARRNNIGLSFDECIERVWIDASGRKEDAGLLAGGERDSHREAGSSREQARPETSTLDPREPVQPGVPPPATPEKGRSRGGVSRTCSHCGLLASSITNLTVHIRRKHSHQYSYLCKVCKYYTVTKGDMERHCATKKHRGRVDAEARGRRGSDIVVGPEGGALDTARNGDSAVGAAPGRPALGPAEPDAAAAAEKPPGEQGSPAGVGADAAPHPPAAGQAGQPGTVGPLGPEDPAPQEDASPGDAPGAGEHRCTHCEFQAHSAASLELHVKRKHTKEFAFYCMACDYYAVTRREMTRHAATEKHRLKRQSYLHASPVRAHILPQPPPLPPPPACGAFQIVAAQTAAALASGPAAAAGPLSEENANPQEPGPGTADTWGEGQPSQEPLWQPLARQPVASHEEVVALETAPGSGSPAEMQDENSGGWAVGAEGAEQSPSDREMQPESAGRGPGEQGDASRSGRTCPPTPVVVSAQPEEPGAPQQPHAAPSSFPEEAAPESRGMSPPPPHEAHPLLQDRPAAGAVGCGLEVCETVVGADEPGQAPGSPGHFDSAIIRIGSPELGEGAESAVEGPRPGEPPSRDCAPGPRRRRVEGGVAAAPAAAARIRCEDCGFLADGLSGLNVHIAMKHPSKEKHFHCLLCGKSFYTESNLHQHLASAGHQRNEQASVEELPEGGATFRCVKCAEPFDSEQSLFLHIKGQHEELLREVNKYIAEDTEQINRERQENQGNVCRFCGKMCRSSNSMAFLAHIRTHTGSKPFKCKICHFATAQLGDARNHVKRHLGMREYKCHVCGVAFVMKKHLNTHLLGKHGVGTPKERSKLLILKKKRILCHPSDDTTAAEP
ncbi:zinc finger protein 407 [Erinaceus europaeus]|uniref:Zinc finger protein 407 n=1 Tax=Erinaceus europaeus TaxID=9365 RepID=A0ABM3W0D0_ERIEU|nr:zinc finger protein 407 [Erinaceus europaeus]